MVPVPKGLEEINAVFGSAGDFAENPSAWELGNIVTVKLKYPVVYAYKDSTRVSTIRCHRKLVEIFVETLAQCSMTGVPEANWAFGGIYTYRSTRKGHKLSTHSWGIAIDLGPATNPFERPWNHRGRGLSKKIIDIWTNAGFEWGGRWRTPDPMHFQYCRGY